MFVCCVLSGRGLCDEVITRPEESYRLWLVAVCDQETAHARRLKPRYRPAKYKPTTGCSTDRKKKLLITVTLKLCLYFNMFWCYQFLLLSHHFAASIHATTSIRCSDSIHYTSSMCFVLFNTYHCFNIFHGFHLLNHLNLPIPMLQQPPSRPGFPYYRGFMISLRRTTVGGTPLNV